MTAVDIRHFPMHVGGEQVDSDRKMEILHPATGEVVATVAQGDVSHLDAAVAAAKAAFDEGSWSRATPAERAAVMRRIAEAAEEEAGELVQLEMMCNGATVRQATGFHIGYALAHLVYFAELAETYEWSTPLGVRSFPALGSSTVRREPIGVVGAISPWNFPLLLTMWKVGPALAAGNSIVIKPDEHTPLTMLAFARICEENGLPKGVLNVVPGDGREIGSRLASHPDVGKIGFTGSTEVGREIMRLASGTVKKVTLELGGKSPTIVLDDADLEMAADGILYGCMLYSGQACESGTRAFVPSAIYDDFVARLVARAETIQVGDPEDWDTDLGPVIDARQRDKVLEFIEGAKKAGARVALGGGVPEGEQFQQGNWIAPTILRDVTNDMQVAREEIFGPVLCVIPYDTENEALAMANDTDYGLAAMIWSGDNERALALAERIESGNVWINDAHQIHAQVPFGGYKQSGIGRELGPRALDEYTQVKAVHLDLSGGRDRKPYDIVLSHAD